MPNSTSSYPTCESCIYLDMSYQGEGPDYGVCRHNRKAYKDYANGVPMMVCPVIHPNDPSCAYYSDGPQPALPVGEGDRLIKKMLAASLEISAGNPSVDQKTLKTSKTPRYNCEKRS